MVLCQDSAHYFVLATRWLEEAVRLQQQHTHTRTHTHTPTQQRQVTAKRLVMALPLAHPGRRKKRNSIFASKLRESRVRVFVFPIFPIFLTFAIFPASCLPIFLSSYFPSYVGIVLASQQSFRVTAVFCVCVWRSWMGLDVRLRVCAHARACFLVFPYIHGEGVHNNRRARYM